jgi:hypothetical protein
MSKNPVDLRKNIWLLFIPILWWGSSAASGWLSPAFESPSFEFLEFAVHSARNADYGIDPFTSALAPIDPSIIDEALTDQGNSIPLIPPVKETDPSDAPSTDDQDGSDTGSEEPPDATPDPTQDPTPDPTPAPTTDPGNGNGNSGENGSGSGNENGNGGENGNSGNGNGGGGGPGPAPTPDPGKGKDKNK